MRQSCAAGLVRSFVYNVCHFRTEENQRLSPNNENCVCDTNSTEGTGKWWTILRGNKNMNTLPCMS